MKLSACSALFLLLLANPALAEEFAPPDLTVEQPKPKSVKASPAKKPAGLEISASKWAPDSTDKSAKAFTTRSDFCGGCELNVKVRQEDRDERLRRRFESFE